MRKEFQDFSSVNKNFFASLLHSILEHRCENETQVIIKIMSSFPKHSSFYKLFGTLIVIMILSSLAIIAVKKCHKGIAYEHQYKDLRTDEDVNEFIKYYFVKLHVLHSIGLIGGSIVIVLAFIDVVPDHDEDYKFAFHLISVFVIAIMAFLTLYGSYVSNQKPCYASTNSTCCSITPAPKLFENTSRPSITAFSQRDKSMIAVMALDGIAGFLLFITAMVYYWDMRNEAKQCGYLDRVHNFNYLSRV